MLLGLLFGVALLTHAAPAHAQRPPAPWAKGGQSNPNDLKISLLTFGPGADVPSWFGHTAIAVEDLRLRQARAYNYGMFSFDSTVVPKYIMGRLEFWVGDVPMVPMLEFYKSLDRDVRVLELNLPSAQRAEIAAALEKNILPEHRMYLYHHYDDNCATRIRDLIDDATQGQFATYSNQPAAHDLRGHTRRHAQIGLLDFGMMYAMTSNIDEPITAWDEMFLPSELERHVLAFTYETPDGERVPLAGKNTTYYASKTRAPVPDDPAPIIHIMALLGVAVGALGFALSFAATRRRRRATRVLYGLFNAGIGASFGLAGCFILFAWIFTDHSVMYHNENLFLTNPLTFLLFPLGLGVALGRERAQRLLPRLWLLLAAIALLGLLLKVLPGFFQQNWLTMALCLPMILAMAAASWIFFIRPPEPAP